MYKTSVVVVKTFSILFVRQKHRQHHIHTLYGEEAMKNEKDNQQKTRHLHNVCFTLFNVRKKKRNKYINVIMKLRLND